MPNIFNRIIFPWSNKATVIIYLDSYKRDQLLAENLAEKFRENDFYVFIASRRSFYFSCLILNPNDIFIIGQLDIAEQVRPIVDSQIHLSTAECWACDFYGSAYFPPEKKYYKNLKNIFIWGSKSMNWIIDNRSSQIEDTDITIAGFPRSLPLRNIRLKRKSEINNKKIGLVGKFSALNDLYSRPAIEQILLGLNHGDSDHTDWPEITAERITIESKIMKIYTDIIKSEELSSSYFSIRPHPTEKTTTYNKYFDHVSAKEEVCDWLTDLDLVIGPASTLIYDCYLAGIPYVCIDYINNTVDKTIRCEALMEWFYDLSINPKSLEELVDIVVLEQSKKLRTTRSIDQDNRVLSTLINNNINAVSLIANKSIPTFKRKKDILIFWKNIIVYTVDITMIVYHLIFKPYRLSFDYILPYFKSNKK
tara:strand:+ start:30215 stop:31477 length:1263 start_codon:yes stop_codon:yes gene_type:complete